MIANLPLLTNSNESYLETISKIPLLTADQEFKFAVQYKESKDKDLAYTLVVSNLRIVAHIARGFENYGLPLADLVQEGTIGLLKAIDKFDPYAGVRLVTYAAHWIKAEIYEFIVRNWRIVKIATTKAQRKLFFNMRKSKKNINNFSLEDAKKLAIELNVDLKDVFEMEKRFVSHDAHFEPLNEEDYLAPGNYLEQENSDPALLIEQEDYQTSREIKLYEALETLDERSRDIVKARWLNEEKSTLEILSVKYNISKERVRQLEQIALKKLQGII